ncbi:hypothetical protein IDM40_17185 [Nocardiopsis sp. HNM0947]|uniref:Uncharacterized protein n=1 Tax=Nocardiopsis coralli TaxID=2772213 RepID=A0ABR9P9A6_9ACTN|nr:hypothetical protein [Nocardiopsis coralli]MBE3000421.1 hypothetical protein [Nocardiopsis coralli]
MTGVAMDTSGLPVFLHDGAFYQLATLDDLAEAGLRVRPVHVRDLVLGEDTLEGADRLFVADRLHPGLWTRAAESCVDVARRGGTVFVSGENALDAVPGVELTRTGTNFWWWRTGEDPGIDVLETGEELQRHLVPRAQRWHFHGVMEVPDHTEVLAHHRETGPEWPAGALLAVDRASTAGVIAVTTMDPVYHHGSRFMPGASLLLHGVMRWLCGAEPRPGEKLAHGSR